MKYLSIIIIVLISCSTIHQRASAQVLPSVKKAQSTQAAWEKAKRDAADAMARAAQLEKDCKADWTVAHKELKALKDQYDASVKAIAATEAGVPKKIQVEPSSAPKEGPTAVDKGPGFSSSIPTVAAAKPDPREKDSPPPFTFKDPPGAAEPPKADAKISDPKRIDGLMVQAPGEPPTVAILSVTLPAAANTAKLWIGWQPTKLAETKATGAYRIFSVSDLTVGSTYTYYVRMQIDGKDSTKKISVKGGMKTEVVFD